MSMSMYECVCVTHTARGKYCAVPILLMRGTHAPNDRFTMLYKIQNMVIQHFSNPSPTKKYIFDPF